MPVLELFKKITAKLFTREIITYIIAGVLTTALSIVIFWLCRPLGTVGANTVSTVLAVLFAFCINKLWVFQSYTKKTMDVLRELLTFSAGRFFTYVLETVLLVVLIDYSGLPGTASKIFTSVVVIVLNFAISKWAVFRKPTSF